MRSSLTFVPDGVGRPRLRADSGLFSAEVAGAALAAGADFAIAADRPELAGELYQAVQAYKQETAQAKVEGRDAEPLDLTAVIDPFPYGQLPQRVPEVGWNAKQTRRWLELLQGEWLEIWTQQQVRKTVPDWPAWYDVNGMLALSLIH